LTAESYKFSHFLIVTTIVLAGNSKDDGIGSDSEDATESTQQRGKTKKRRSGNDGDFLFSKLEDEVYHQACGGMCFRYKVDGSSAENAGHAAAPGRERLVMLVPSSRHKYVDQKSGLTEIYLRF
jgi:hypothetical protein